ncbi:MAG TPA: TonB-dependent receptor [Bacteroidales bacterium]|nr:TonB-dependent receptor [Bacteroidales bacterium]
MRKIFIIGLLLASMLAPGLTTAQSGVIKGRVFDAETNEPLPFTNIVVWDNPTIGSTSDLEGNFSFTGLKPGYIRLKATSIGYEDIITEAILVTNARTSTVQIAMKPRSVDLEMVVVEATPFRRLEESPVSLRTLGIDEIDKNPGANRDISKVIQSLPGVAQSVSFRNDVIVRGGGPNENSFVLDGVEIPYINHFSTQGASGGPVGILNVDFIREIDLYSGAFPASRGNALSSVLVMNQVDGNPDKFNFRTTLGATDLAFSAEGPLSDRSSLIFSVRRSYLQFLFNLIGLPFLPTYNDMQFKYKLKIDQKNELSVIGLAAYDVNELNLGITEPTEEQQYILDYLPANEQWSYTLGTVYKHFRNNGFDTWVISRSYLNNVAYKYIDNDDRLARTFDYASSEAENKLRFERLQRIGNTKITYGAGAVLGQYGNDTRRSQFAFGELQTLDYSTRLELFAYHLQGQLSQSWLDERLTVSAGLRTDASNYDEAMSNPLQQLSPRASASYALTEKLFLNANLGRYYQRPPYTTLGYRDASGALVNREAGVKYILADHFVAGVELMPDKNSRLTLEGFYKDYAQYPFSLSDSLAIASKGADFGTFGDEAVDSRGEGRAFGAELYYRNRDLAGFNVILSYTLVRSEFKDISGSYVPTAWDNRHLLNFTLTRSLKGNWDIGAKWRLVGGSPYTPYDEERSASRLAWDARGMGYLDYSRFNSLRLGTFHQLDIRVDKQFYFDRWSLMLYLDIQNLYNFQAEQPAVLYNRDENGLPVVLNPGAPLEEQRYQLRYLENTSGTVLPTLGVMIEF